MTLTNTDRLQMSHRFVAFGTGNASGKLWGMKANIEWLGLTPSAAGGDLALSGVDLVVSVGGYRRARYLGDTTGAAVGSKTVIKRLYPTQRGNALPGDPIKIRNVEAWYDLAKTQPVEHTFSLEGDWGSFIEFMAANRASFDMRLWSPTGARSRDVLLKV